MKGSELIKKLPRGDMIEVFLAADALRFRDTTEIYSKDKGGETNIPNRTWSGYISGFGDDFIYITPCWDNENNKVGDNVGATRFDFDAIEGYSTVSSEGYIPME